MSDLKIRILSSLSVLHEGLCLVLGELSIIHPDSTSIDDGDAALSEVLKKVNRDYLKSITSMTYACNTEKIYNGGEIKTKIDIKGLDTMLIFNILISIKNYCTCYKSNPKQKKKKGKKGNSCSSTGHTGKCCASCDHTCQLCKKGGICKCCNITGASCNHVCQGSKCGMLKTDCYTWSKICCNSCMTCGHCNKLKPEAEQCVIYKLKVAIGNIRHIRNFLSHCSLVDLDALNNNSFYHSNFPNCSNWDSFCDLMGKSLDYCLQFLSDKGYLKKRCLGKEKVEKLKLDFHIAINYSVDKVSKHFSISNDDLQKSIEREQVTRINLKEHRRTRKMLKRELNEHKEIVDESLRKHGEETHGKLDQILHAITVNNEESPTKTGKLEQDENVIPYKNQFLLDRKTACGFILTYSAHASTEIEKILLSRENERWTEINNPSYHVHDEKLYVHIENLESGFKYRFRMFLENKEGQKNVVGLDDLEAVDEDRLEHITSVDGVILRAHCSGNDLDVHAFIENNDSTRGPSKVKCRFTPGSNVNNITVPEFQEIGENYLYRNFCEGEIPYIKKVLRLPPKQRDKKDATSDIACLVENHLKKYNSHFRAVLTRYNGTQHLKYIGYTKKQLNDHGITSVDGDNRILLLTPTVPVILSIRVVDGSLDAIQEGLRTTNADLKSLLLAYQYLLKDKHVALCGVVACPSLTRIQLNEMQYLCADCKPFVLSKDDLCNAKGFKNWWETVLEETLFPTLRQYKEESKEQLNALLFQICSQTAAVMATISTDLPTLSANIHDQVTTVMLNEYQLEAIYSLKKKRIVKGPYGSGKSLAAKEIVKSIFLSSNVKTFLYYICADPYTLLDFEMTRYADELYKRNKDSPVEIICKNITEMAGEYNLEDFSPYELIHQLGEKHKKTLNTSIHLVIDELDGENFPKEEASRLTMLFKFNDAYKDSNVVIMTQGLEKNRVLHVGDKEHPHSKNHFDGTGMEVITLPSTMRFSNHVHKLLISAQETIAKTKNILCTSAPVIDTQMDTQNTAGQVEGVEQPKMNMVFQNVAQQDEVQSLGKALIVSSSLNVSEESNEYFTDEGFEELEDMETDSDSGHFQNIGEEPMQSYTATFSHVSTVATPPVIAPEKMHPDKDESILLTADTGFTTDSELSEVSTPPVVTAGIQAVDIAMPEEIKEATLKGRPRIKLDIDHVSHLIAENNSSSAVKTSTSFDYIPGTCGHSITGTQPALFVFPETFHENKRTAIKMISQVIQNVCLTSSGKAVVLCNDLKDNQLILDAFNVLQEQSDITYVNYIHFLKGIIPTRQEKEEVIKKLHEDKKCVLITDNHGYRGLECETIIMTISPKEYYKKHFFAESLARSTSKLFLLVIDKPENNYQEGTFQDVIDAWINGGLVHVRNVKEGHFSNIYKGSKDEFIVDLNLTPDESIRARSVENINSSIQYTTEDARRLYEQFNGAVLKTGSEEDNEEFQKLPQEVINSIEMDNREEAFLKLLNDNPDIINMRDSEFKRTPFLWSAFHNRPKIMHSLIRKGCDVGVVDVLPLTAYHWCSRNGYSECLQMLLKHDKSHIDKVDGVSQTALMLASKHGQLECVKMLLECGANVHIKNRSQKTAYDEAGGRTLVHNKQAAKDIISKYTK